MLCRQLFVSIANSTKERRHSIKMGSIRFRTRKDGWLFCRSCSWSGSTSIRTENGIWCKRSTNEVNINVNFSLLNYQIIKIFFSAIADQRRAYWSIGRCVCANNPLANVVQTNACFHQSACTRSKVGLLYAISQIPTNAYLLKSNRLHNTQLETKNNHSGPTSSGVEVN